MEHTTKNLEEEKIETKQNSEEQSESRSEYQKRKRNEKKQAKRRSHRNLLRMVFIFVILSGIVCGTVIASKINTSHDSVKIASANVEYMKTTVQNTVKEKLSDLSELWENAAWVSAITDKVKEAHDDIHNPPLEIKPENEDNEDKAQPSDSQSTTESVLSLIPQDNPYGIDPSKPMVALTFDDGPSKYTWSIVSALAKYNARATFFLIGNRVATHEAAIDFVLENHNEVASHSFSHVNLANSTEEEILAQIQKVDDVLKIQHDYIPMLFRVPYGERDEQVLQIMKDQNRPVIGWSVDPRDWEVQDKEQIVKHVLSHVKDGDIILMHDLYKPTADAVAELIPALQEKGYQLVTVSELFQYKGITLIPGTYYYASWKWI